LSRLEPSLGATAPTYKKLVARPQPSRAAERVLPCSRVLPSTHSHVKILSTPLTPLLQGGTITYTLYLCHFQKKKRHNFGQKLINLENFHTFYTFRSPVPRCGATWPGPSSPEGAKFHASFLNIQPDWYLYTRYPLARVRDPEHWYARAALRVHRGPSGHKRGQSSLTQGRISTFYKGWRFPKKRPNKRPPGQRSAIGRKPPLVYETGCYRLTIPPGGGCPRVSECLLTKQNACWRVSEYLLIYKTYQSMVIDRQHQ
jgi:hypothetical protein